MVRKYRNIQVAILMTVVMFMTGITAFADPSIEDVTQERDETQEQLDEVTSTIEELADQQESISNEIEEISAALVQVMAEIEVIRVMLDEKELEIQQAQAAYDEALQRELEQYEAMKIRIQYLYESGNQDLLSIYLETGSISDTLTKAEYIEDLYEYDRQMLSEYQNTVNEVATLQQVLLTEQEELLCMQADYEAEQEYMESIIVELQEVSEDYEEQIAAAESLAAEYAAKIEAQNAEIARLEEEARRQAEEAARRAAEEEARRRAQEAVANSANTGTVTTTGSATYDVSSIYSANGSDLGKSIAVFACQYIGNPYVPGGTSLTNGADCSGFVFSVYKEFGYSVPRTSYSLRSAGTEVAYADAQPGDIICYAGHVAIYIGNGMIVHASSVRTGIKVSRAQYREILCVRRII